MPQIPRRLTTRSDALAEHGQTMAEYSILVGLIAVIVVVALPSVATAIMSLLEPVSAFFGG